MKNQTLGQTIAHLRKEKGMTQAELAKELHLTDKAVSKWERDLSCPDVSAIPLLAETLGVSVEDLMRAQTGKPAASQGRIAGLIDLIFKALALAMGVSVLVMSILGKLDQRSGFTLLGLGLTCLAVSALPKERT